LFFVQPHLLSAGYNDSNQDGMVDGGDNLSLQFDQTVTLARTAAPGDFTLSPGGSLGSTGQNGNGLNASASGNQVNIVLGPGATFVVPGVFNTASNTGRPAPTGIALAATGLV